MPTVEVFRGGATYATVSGAPAPTLDRAYRFHRLSPDTTGNAVKMPHPTAPDNVPEGGPIFVIKNVHGSNTLVVQDHNAATLITLAAGEVVKAHLQGTTWSAGGAANGIAGPARAATKHWHVFHLRLGDGDGDTDVDLRDVVDDLGYDGTGQAQVVAEIPVGGAVRALSTGTPALTTGSWPAGSTLHVANFGTIDGAGGDGGDGGELAGGGGEAGSAAGTALEATYAVTVDNAGSIRGGGGGGGGGGHKTGESDRTGGAGGGGQGGTGGAHGEQGVPDTTSPDPGYMGGAGTGGTSETAGGAGGAWGTAGTAGTEWSPNVGADNDGGAGGAAGNAVDGDAFITWLQTGERLGAVT